VSVESAEFDPALDTETEVETAPVTRTPEELAVIEAHRESLPARPKRAERFARGEAAVAEQQAKLEEHSVTSGEDTLHDQPVLNEGMIGEDKPKRSRRSRRGSRRRSDDAITVDAVAGEFTPESALDADEERSAPAPVLAEPVNEEPVVAEEIADTPATEEATEAPAKRSRRGRGRKPKLADELESTARAEGDEPLDAEVIVEADLPTPVTAETGDQDTDTPAVPARRGRGRRPAKAAADTDNQRQPDLDHVDFADLPVDVVSDSVPEDIPTPVVADAPEPVVAEAAPMPELAEPQEALAKADASPQAALTESTEAPKPKARRGRGRVATVTAPAATAAPSVSDLKAALFDDLPTAPAEPAAGAPVKKGRGRGRPAKSVSATADTPQAQDTDAE